MDTPQIPVRADRRGLFKDDTPRSGIAACALEIMMSLVFVFWSNCLLRGKVIPNR